MNRLLRDLGLILALALLWALGGYLIGLGVEIALIPYPPLKIILASLNVIIGLTLFLGITRDPTAERLFFEGPAVNQEGDIRVGCLWMIPASLVLIGLFVVILGFVFRLLGLK